MFHVIDQRNQRLGNLLGTICDLLSASGIRKAEAEVCVLFLSSLNPFLYYSLLILVCEDYGFYTFLTVTYNEKYILHSIHTQHT